MEGSSSAHLSSSSTISSVVHFTTHESSYIVLCRRRGRREQFLSQLGEIEAVRFVGKLQPNSKGVRHRAEAVRLAVMHDRVLAEGLDDDRHCVSRTAFSCLQWLRSKHTKNLAKSILNVVLKVHLNEFEVGNVLELVAHDVWLVE